MVRRLLSLAVVILVSLNHVATQQRDEGTYCTLRCVALCYFSKLWLSCTAIAWTASRHSKM